jgi:toluene monooxygenase electron transfer component
MSNTTITEKTFQIRLANSDRSYANPAGDNLLRAGLRAGLGLPYECCAGGCGSCKFELLSGEVEELWVDAPGLSAKDRTRGRRLACQCRPLTDCEIKIRCDDSFVAQVLPERFTATYLGHTQVTSDIHEFRFRGPQPARFRPGQYALLDLPGVGQLRAYSMSNLPNADGDWHFMVRRVPGGRVSNLLFDELQAGTTIEIDGPLGLAHWRDDSPRDVVCIAGGSGWAPIQSIANAAAAAASLSDAPRNLWLFYGGRGPADIPDFTRWLQTPKHVNVHPAVSVPELATAAGWTGAQGFVHELMASTVPGPLAEHEYYLAGPPPMIETAVRLLMIDHKVPASQVHYDRFF